MCRMMVADSWKASALGSLWLSSRRHGSYERVLGWRADRWRWGFLKQSAGHLRARIATELVAAVAVVVAAVVAVYWDGRWGHPQRGTKSSPMAMDCLPVGYT